jgi:hypothetical protein
MKRHATMALVLLAMFVIAACSTVRRRPVSGTDIDYEHVQQIEPDKTTRSEIEEWFGPPERTIKNDDGSEELRYRYVGFVDRKLEALVYMRNQTEKETELLRLTMEKGVVTGLEFTNSLEPEQNLKK